MKNRSSIAVLAVIFLLSLYESIYAGTILRPDPNKGQNAIASQSWNRINAAISALDKRTGNVMTLVPARATGIPSFLYVKGKTLPMKFLPTGQEEPVDVANNFLKEYGDIFGMTDPANEMGIKGVSRVDMAGMRQARYQQRYRGIPVVAGEMIVHLKSNNEITMVNGKFLPDIKIDTDPKISPDKALQILSKAAFKYHNLVDYKVTTPELRIFNAGLLKDAMDKTHLVYRIGIEGTSLDGKPVKEKYFIDAHFGSIVFHVSEIHSAVDRNVYNLSGGTTLPGTLVRSEGEGPTGDADADNAYVYAGVTYNYFLYTYGRDSLDNAGMPLNISVHYSTNYKDSYWDGSRVVFGDNMVTPDIMGHELTHGVTQYSAGLYNAYQSGALNESYSDIFGSALDVNWTIGEGSALGVIRDMSNPPGDTPPSPDKVSSNNYSCALTNQGSNDFGGVRINSGVPNKAAYLIAAGGTFNGYSISGIGRTKMELIEYRALTTKLLSGSDFLDNYNAIKTSCQELINTLGITASDCAEVEKALDAVEMDHAPSCPGYPAEVTDYCPPGQTKTDIWYDNLENTTSGNWASSAVSGSVNEWYYPATPNPYGVGPNAASGTNNLWGYDDDNIADYAIRMTADKSVESVWPNAYLQFNHSYMFESSYDGGVLEYSTDGGTTWNDMGSLITMNGYNGTLSNSFGNPLGGQSAFTKDSYGYHSTRVDLTSLKGQDIRIRFRLGTDYSVWDYGWFIDDVRFYYCADTTAPAFGTVTPSNTAYNSFVDSQFDLTTTFTDYGSEVINCAYCVTTDGTCDTEWSAGYLSGSSPTWTCTHTGITGTNGQSLTLNMMATSTGGTGTAAQITRTVDAAAPATSDGQSSSAWENKEKTVTLTPNDGPGSGVTASTGIYGCFGTGCTPVVLGGNTMTTTCGAGNKCIYDVRYYSRDNVGNTEWTKTSAYQAMVDREAPTVTSATSSSPDGYYKAGSAINITINFSENISSSGLTIHLNSGGSVKTGLFSGVTSWGGTYTVEAGENSSDLSISSIEGTIADAVSNSTANPALAAGQNIADSKAIVIDTTAPTVSISSPSPPVTNVDPVTYTITYTGANTVTLANGDVNLINTGDADGEVAVSGAGNTTRTVTISGITGDGTLGISIAADTASDTAGNTASSAESSITVKVDNTDPIFSLTTPETGSFIDAVTAGYTLSEGVETGSLTFEQTGGAEDPGSPHTYAFTASDKTAGSHSINPAFALVDGAIYSVTFDAADSAGNTADTVTNTDILYNTSAAVVTLISPAAGSRTNNAEVTYALSEGIQSGDIVFTRTGGNPDSNSYSYTLAVGERTPGSHTVDTGFNLVDGAIYSAGFENVSDGTGAPTNDVTNANVTYDEAAVVITDTSPAAGSAVNNSGVSYTLSAAADSVTITFARTGGGPDNGSPHVYTSSGLTAGPHTILSGVPLVDGSVYTVSFDATNHAGNPATAISNALVTYDTSAPLVSISSPSPPVTNVDPVTYTITYTGADTVTLADGDVMLINTGDADGEVAVSGTGNTTRTVTIYGITGDGKLGISLASATASDTAGNAALAAGPSATFTVDNTAPTVDIDGPSASWTRSGSITYTVTYTGADTVTLADGDVMLINTGDADGEVAVSGTGNTTRTVTISGITGDGTLGISLASATASDTAGNTALAAGPSETFSVDNTAPQVGNVTPSGTINNAYPVIAADFSDSVSGSGIAGASLSLDGGPALSNCTTTEVHISCDSSHLLSGEHTIGGAVTDIASNSSTISGSFTVEYLPVRIAGVSPSYHALIQDAFNEVIDGDIIQIQAGDFLESQLNFDKSDVTVTLHGGYDAGYTKEAGTTSIAGLTISNGTVIMEQITVK